MTKQEQIEALMDESIRNSAAMRQLFTDNNLEKAFIEKLPPAAKAEYWQIANKNRIIEQRLRTLTNNFKKFK